MHNPDFEKVREGYGTWLSKYPWQLWCTLTFRYAPSSASALRSYRRWLNRSGLWLGGLPYSFVGTEEGRLFGRVHLHALIGVGRCNDSLQIDREWLWSTWYQSYGRALILPYDRSKGASFYISKYITKELGDYEVLGSWPSNV